jgi:ADP-ribose pyrophosphatase YjhB (NUDIX family)
VDLGETLEAACLRELREETGLEAEVVRLVGVYSDPEGSLHIGHGPERHTVRVSFLCRATGGSLATSSETSEVRYFPVDALPPLITDHVRRIQDALSGEPRAVIA